MATGLTPPENKWFIELRDKFARFPHDGPFEQREASLDTMRHTAEQLVASFRARGLKPPHSSQLVQNRGMDNKHPFYHNYHAIEDVVRFAAGLFMQPDGEASDKGKR